MFPYISITAYVGFRYGGSSKALSETVDALEDAHHGPTRQ
jgi:hypothetical protein